VLITKFRRKCLNAAMLHDLRHLISEQMALQGGRLLEFNGESDHAHMLITLPPSFSISSLVNILKSTTSRSLRRKHGAHLRQYYWKPYLWSRSYFVASCGGAPLDIVKQYIQQQESPAVSGDSRLSPPTYCRAIERSTRRNFGRALLKEKPAS
jgi:putative transposase